MTSRDFCYWLQGYFEVYYAGMGERSSERLTGIELSGKQVENIKKHLAMVFRHEIDPSFGKDQATLTKIHQGIEPGQVDPLLPGGGFHLNC